MKRESLIFWCGFALYIFGLVTGLWFGMNANHNIDKTKYDQTVKIYEQKLHEQGTKITIEQGKKTEIVRGTNGEIFYWTH